MDYQKAIEYYQKSGIQFDYIFLDPPYHMSISPIITMVRPLLKADGTLICEIEKKSVYETDLTVIKERAHGIKKIILMKK
jgi:16S rRNA G966 N2-methylase RsmD